MKKAAALILSLVLLIVLAGCGTAAPASNPESAPAAESEPESSRPAEPAGGGVQIGNPYVTLQDKAEMEAEAGFEVTLPKELPDWISTTIYRAMPGKLAEIIYQGESNELRVRIANGSEDISGVYDSGAAVQQDLTVDGKTVTVKGETQEDGTLLIFTAVWTGDGRTYSLTSPEGADQTVFEDMIAVIH